MVGSFFLLALLCPALTSVADFLPMPPPLFTRIRASPKARQAKSKSRIQVTTRSSERKERKKSERREMDEKRGREQQTLLDSTAGVR